MSFWSWISGEDERRCRKHNNKYIHIDDKVYWYFGRTGSLGIDSGRVRKIWEGEINGGKHMDIEVDGYIHGALKIEGKWLAFCEFTGEYARPIYKEES